MCGIAGVYGLGERHDHAPAVGRMVESLRHRGPDSDGWTRSQFAHVGFRRLSIIDLATGDQPLKNEDGTVECFLNGEIYNYVALRDDLQAWGHVFKTTSDTEVLPHLWEELGEAMFARLRGMFVICVVDHRTRSVVLARDQFGVKQLYYARTPDGVAFASEVKALLASGLVEPEVDRSSIVPYLALLYSPEPHTLLRGVLKLPPGCLLRLEESGQTEPVEYYRVPAARLSVGADEASEGLVSLLAESVKLQLQADVPVGISLSGGIDSSVLACLAGMERGSRESLTAITISWPGTPPGELAHSRELCGQLGLAHEILEPEVGGVDDELPLLAWMSDEPVADPATYSQFRVAQAAASVVKVLLGGAGGDELFGGYGHYALPFRKSLFAALPAPWQRSLRRVVVPRMLDESSAEALLVYRRSRRLWHARAMTHLSPDDERLLLESVGGTRSVAANINRLFAAHAHRDPINQQLAVDLQSYLPEQLLPMLDRATMAASVEGRVPFIDVPLVEYSMSLGGAAKLGWPRVRKRLLKRAFADRLPRQILRGKKSGMPSHFPVFVAQHPSLVRRLVGGPDSFARSVLPAKWLDTRLASGDAMLRAFPVLYALVMLETWHRLFVVERVYDRPDVSLAELFRIPRDVAAVSG